MHPTRVIGVILLLFGISASVLFGLIAVLQPDALSALIAAAGVGVAAAGLRIEMRARPSGARRPAPWAIVAGAVLSLAGLGASYFIVGLATAFGGDWAGLIALVALVNVPTTLGVLLMSGAFARAPVPGAAFAGGVALIAFALIGLSFGAEEQIVGAVVAAALVPAVLGARKLRVA